MRCHSNGALAVATTHPQSRRSAAEVPTGGMEWRVDLQEGVFGRWHRVSLGAGGVPGQAAGVESSTASAGVSRRSTFGGSSTPSASNTAFTSLLGVVVCW